MMEAYIYISEHGADKPLVAVHLWRTSLVVPVNCPTGLGRGGLDMLPPVEVSSQFHTEVFGAGDSLRATGEGSWLLPQACVSL